MADRIRLSWDGSYIGKYPNTNMDILRHEGVMKYVRLRCLSNKGKPITLLVRIQRIKNVYPCIVDECKQIFGMIKIGTHRVRIGLHTYVMYDLPQNNLVLLSEYALPEDEVRLKKFKLAVQKTYQFRIMMGLGCNWDSSILVLPGGIPTSYRNSVNLEKCGKKTAMSRSLGDKWFDRDIEVVFKMIHRVQGSVSMSSIKMQEVIRRLDPNLIWTSQVMTSASVDMC